MRELTKNEVEFEVTIEPSDIPVRGNYMATEDSEADKAAEDEILSRLKQDDITAWCEIKVTAKWEEFTGFAVMDGCSFASDQNGQKEVEEMADDHGMHAEALADLNRNVRGHVMNASDIQNKLSD